MLAPAGESDPPVLVDVVDSISPPALMLVWGEPWLLPGTTNGKVMGPCLYTYSLGVLCVAGRLEPGAGGDMLDQLVSHTLGRFRADAGYSWPLARVESVRELIFGRDPGISYLTARVLLRRPGLPLERNPHDGRARCP